MNKTYPFLAAIFGAVLVGSAHARLPDGSEVSAPDSLVEENGVSVAKSRVKVKVPIPADTSRILIEATAGTGRLGLNAALSWADGSDSTLITFRSGGENGMDDQFLWMARGKRLFIRPNVAFYATPARRQRMVEHCNDLPAASSSPLKIEIRSSESRAEIWVNDRFMDLVQGRGGFLHEIEFDLDEGASIKNIAFGGQTVAHNRYLPINVEGFARPSNWKDIMGDMAVEDRMQTAKLSLAPGAAVVGQIPFQVARAERNINVSHLGWVACPSDDGSSIYWRRSSLDALPESCIISVPLDTYASAYVLCAAHTDGEGLIPEFTVRLSRNANGRGDALADTRVKLPADGRETADAKKVGTVEYGQGGARKRVPLWLVRVPLKSGRIQDVLRENESEYGYGVPLPTDRYLDVEIMEPIDGSEEDEPFPTDFEAPMRRNFMPPRLRTSVHVFGLTLERSPAELTVRSNVPGFVFYPQENAALRAELNIRESAKYAVEWNVADVDGKIVLNGRREITGTAGNQDLVEIPLTVGNGWYASQVKLSDAAGRCLVDHRGSFVIVPPDTRKAGRESPFGTWWFNWAHGGTKDYVNVGRLLERAGLRHTMLDSDTVMAAYQVTTWCIPWRQPTIDNWVGGLEQHIRAQLEKTPGATTVMIHHESDSYEGRFPSELWGEAPKPQSEKMKSAWEVRMKYLIPALKMIREQFPQLKIQFGNTGDSCALVAEMLRLGVPKEYVDYVAVEDLGQAIIPERPVLGGVQSAWFLRETARHFGYTDTKVTGCYEWINRMDHKIGLQLQAEYYTRDALHALAYGFHTIALAAVHDAGQAYFHSIWGNGGLTYRYPYMYPKPSYASMATLTRIVDSAKFTRMVPTGSTSLYALEFQRGDNEWVYALWTPRGSRETVMAFSEDADRVVTDLYGRESLAKGRAVTVTAATGAKYVTSKSKVETITAGRSSFPGEPVPPANATLVDTLDGEGSWRMDPASEAQRMSGLNFPHRRSGNFAIRNVRDEEKGRSIELELIPQTSMPWPAVHDHVLLKSNDPQFFEGGPYKHVGLWVKGNSSWGEVNIRVVGLGNKRTTLYPNLKGSGYLNYDGWAFMEFNLPSGPEWEGDIQVEGIYLSTSTQVLYGTEFTSVNNLKIRLHGLYLY